MNDLLKRIDEELNESWSYKESQIKALGLKNVAFNNYEDKNGNPYHWSVQNKEFIKFNKKQKLDHVDENLKYKLFNLYQNKNFNYFGTEKDTRLESFIKSNLKLNVDVSYLHKDRERDGEKDLLTVKMNGKEIAKMVGSELIFGDSFLDKVKHMNMFK